jgi:putative aldouronate transport system permease protein
VKSYRKTPGETLFAALNTLFMAFILLVTLYPFWYIAVGSVSSVAHIFSQGMLLWPDQLSLAAYEFVIGTKGVSSALGNSAFITVAGTLLSMALTTMGAYVLSKPYLPGRKTMTLFIVVTMLFNGGLIPFYLVVKSLGMIDTIWAMMIPYAISTYNMIIMRNFLQAVPRSLEESAMVDGARHFTIFAKIYLPLSMPVIATVTLFYAVGYWNSIIPAIYFLNRRDFIPIQVILREVLIQSRPEALQFIDSATSQISENIKMALVVITVAPIAVIYPFLQKYFVKGVMVGSIKG